MNQENRKVGKKKETEFLFLFSCLPDSFFFRQEILRCAQNDKNETAFSHLPNLLRDCLAACGGFFRSGAFAHWPQSLAQRNQWLRGRTHRVECGRKLRLV